MTHRKATNAPSVAPKGSPHLAALALPLLLTVGCAGDAEPDPSGLGGSSSTATPTETRADSCPPAVQFSVERTFWHSGFRVTLENAEYLPANRDCPGRITIAAEYENLLGDRAALHSNLLLVSGDFEYSRTTPEHDRPYVESHLAADGALSFRVDESFDLSVATLLVGDDDEHRAVVPLGAASPSTFLSLEPYPLQLEGFVFGSLEFTPGDAQVIASDGAWMLPEDTLTIRIPAETTYDGSRAPHGVLLSHFELETPTGEIVQSERASFYGAYQGERSYDVVEFRVRTPASGPYIWRLVGPVDANVDGDSTHEVPFTLPVLANLGETTP